MNDKPLFFEKLERLDRLMGSVSSDVPQEFLDLVHGSDAASDYAYSELRREDWLASLEAAGCFDDPSGVLRDADGNARAQPWAQGSFLKHIAKSGEESSKKLVFEIMLRIGSTDNQFIHKDLAEAAMFLPATSAAEWAHHEARWLQAGNFMFGILEREYGQLAVRLARDREVGAAIALAAEVLEVLPDPDAKTKMEAACAESFGRSLTPRLRCERYQYEQFLEATISNLVQEAPLQTIEMLCKLLSGAVAHSSREGMAAKPRDYTFVSRPAIENHGQNHGYGVADPLISALRDAAETICRQGMEQVRRVVEAIELHEWDVFKRIGLHLLRVTSKVPSELVEARLVNPDLFDCSGVNHEYFQLLKKRFPELSPEGQATILAWIDSGDHHRAYLDRHEKEWSVEQRESNLRYWQYNKLLCIKEHLRGVRAQKLEELEKKFGEPAIPPDFHSWMGGVQSIGLLSPRRPEELGELSVEALVDFLKSWKPPGDFGGPSPEGLGGSIATLIAGNPEKYAEKIECFEDEKLSPVYLSYVVSGFAKALEGGKHPPFETLFRLCAWVVGKSGAVRGSAAEDSEDSEKNWSRPRREIASLFAKIFDEQCGLPFELRDAVWRIIAPLTDDPEPDLAYEARYGGENMDPLSLSINSVRGNAMHGVVRYALWICRKSEATIRSEKNRPPSLADMPEVRAVLDAHLDQDRNQFALNLTDRAVYGDWLPQLMHIDAEWVRANLPIIFPEAKAHRRLRLAAWNTYVMYSPRIFKQVFDLIRHLYCEEVGFLKDSVPGKGVRREPEEKLLEHVMVIYAWGWDDLAPGSLVDGVFANASDEFKAHALSFIGRTLRNDEKLEPETIGRFKALWEWRVAAVGGAARLSEKELGEFGWWFASGRCGEDWGFSNLEKVLERTGALSGDTDVFERVSQVFDGYPKESLRCLRLFVLKTPNQWFFNLERHGGTWEILRKGMAHGSAEVRAAAEEIIHLLGSKGYLRYRDLLKKTPWPREEGAPDAT